MGKFLGLFMMSGQVPDATFGVGKFSGRILPGGQVLRSEFIGWASSPEKLPISETMSCPGSRWAKFLPNVEENLPNFAKFGVLSLHRAEYVSL